MTSNFPPTITRFPSLNWPRYKTYAIITNGLPEGFPYETLPISIEDYENQNISNWIVDNLKDEWVIGLKNIHPSATEKSVFVYFKSQDDFMHFRLRWE